MYAGAAGAVDVKTEGGVQFVLFNGEWREAVAATAGDLAKMPGQWASASAGAAQGSPLGLGVDDV